MLISRLVRQHRNHCLLVYDFIAENCLYCFSYSRRYLLNVTLLFLLDNILS